MRREPPYRIVLPALTVTPLAQILLRLVQRSGLMLCQSPALSEIRGCQTDEQVLPVLELIVRQTYSDSKIAERNGYLATSILKVCIPFNPLICSALFSLAQPFSARTFVAAECNYAEKWSGLSSSQNDSRRFCLCTSSRHIRSGERRADCPAKDGPNAHCRGL